MSYYDFSNPLHLAAEHGNMDTLTRLLHTGRCDVNARDGWAESTPIMMSVERNHQQMTEMLIRHGVDLSVRDHVGDTVLMTAVCNDLDPGCVLTLLEHGAPVDVPDLDGWTPLMAAVYRNSISGVRLLLTAGASLTLRNKDGRTAAEEAVARDRADIVEMLQRELMRRRGQCCC